MGNPNSNKILLLGSTGYTGRIIVSQWQQEKIHFSIAGRNLTDLTELKSKNDCVEQVISIDIQDSKSVREVLEKFDVVVNCIGPFNVWSETIRKEVFKLPIAYFDITGEQDFVKRSFDNANQCKAVMVHSLSFESAFADLLADKILDPATQYHSIHSYYHFSKTRPSPGTRFTMQVARCFPTYNLTEGTVVTVPPLQQLQKVNCTHYPDLNAAVFIPYPEVLFFHSTYQVKNSSTFFLLPDLEAKMMMMSEGAPKDLKSVIEKNRIQKVAGPNENEREKQEFALYIHAEDESGKKQTIALRGTDMYRLTASLITEGVKNNQKHGPGVYTPSKFLGKNFLENFVVKENLELLNEANLLTLA